ncbi:MAG TPA: hypothetical protein VD973_10035 [Symbiobacteriaceae bacterium]|nr:hypothetical protein [Symbiobacteriaceae bacterium]
MHRAVNITLILIFCLGLSIPLAGFFFEQDPRTNPRPTLSDDIFEYAVDLKDYFEDNLGFKRTLVNWNSSLLASIGFSDTPAVAVNDKGEVVYAGNVQPIALPTAATGTPMQDHAGQTGAQSAPSAPVPDKQGSAQVATMENKSNTTATQGGQAGALADPTRTQVTPAGAPVTPADANASKPVKKPPSKAPQLDLGALPKALVGKDGWLYYTSSLDHSPLSETVLGYHKEVLERERDWLKEQGIPYVIVFAPDKKTIYPEFVPSGFQWDQYASRQDQLIEYLGKYSDLRIVDLRPSMQAARAANTVYYKHDTHWNALGSFAGYTEIVKQLGTLFPGVNPLPLSSYSVTWGERKGGDLASMLGIQASVTEPDPILTPIKKSTVETEDVKGLNLDPQVIRNVIVTTKPDAEIPSAVIFRDSFTTVMIPQLSEHFQKATYIWTDQFMEDWVQKEKPSVVIRILVERKLLFLHKTYKGL